MAGSPDGPSLYTSTMKVFPPKFTLPSYDPDCLSALAYGKFGGAPIEVKSDDFSRLGLLFNSDFVPCLSDVESGKSAHSVESIIDLFREMKHGTDFELTQKECADAVAFIEMMKARLLPAVMHTYWLEPGNYEELTRETYALALPLPAAIFYPWKMKEKASDLVYGAEARENTKHVREDIEKRIYRDAVCCLNYLSDKLGTKPFLFGNTPTTVDAIMFGYLAPLLRINFPRNRLKGHIESFQNIVQTIDFILRRYFPPTAKDLEERRTEEQTSRGMGEEDKEFPNKGRDTFIAIVFGLTVIFSYAVLRAGISIVVEDDNMDDID